MFYLSLIALFSLPAFAANVDEGYLTENKGWCLLLNPYSENQLDMDDEKANALIELAEKFIQDNTLLYSRAYNELEDMFKPQKEG